MKLRPALIKLFTFFGRKFSFISDRTFVQVLYFISFGHFPSLDNPKTFNEHICAIKLSDKAYSFAPYASKSDVRKYVSEMLGEEYLSKTYGLYSDAKDIPFNLLPNSFALKCVHASGYNILVPDKSTLNISSALLQLNNWLKINYYNVGREKNYKNISPAILVEEYIEDFDSYNEYKIFCFSGRAEFIEVSIHKNGKRYSILYYPNWETIPVIYGYPLPKTPPEKPDNLSHLILAAEKLSQPFDFVRVDLYSNNNKILFSELTFTPGGGIVPFKPAKYDIEFGKYFKNLNCEKNIL